MPYEPIPCSYSSLMRGALVVGIILSVIFLMYVLQYLFSVWIVPTGTLFSMR
jgi:hypothetical protein